MISARARVREVLRRRTLLHTDALLEASSASLRLHLPREEGLLVTIGRRCGRSNTNLWCLADCTADLLDDVEAANRSAYTIL